MDQRRNRVRVATPNKNANGPKTRSSPKTIKTVKTSGSASSSTSSSVPSSSPHQIQAPSLHTQPPLSVSPTTVERYAGPKFCSPPSPASLPRIPSAWRAMSERRSNDGIIIDNNQKAVEIKMLLKVHA